MPESITGSEKTVENKLTINQNNEYQLDIEKVSSHIDDQLDINHQNSNALERVHSGITNISTS